MADLQDFWGSGDGAAIAAAAVGEASIVMQSLVITFTPRPTPPNEDDQDDDVQAVALGGSSSRAYDRTKSGTSTHIRAGSYSDAGHDDGFDRISGVRITPGFAGTEGTGTGGAASLAGSSAQAAATINVATTSKHGANDSWDKALTGNSTYSLTDAYTYSTDCSFSIETTGWSDDVGEDDGEVGHGVRLSSKSGNVSQGSAMQAITANGQVSATNDQWSLLANQMNNDSFGGFDEDFSLSVFKDERRSMELASSRLRTEYDLTRTFTPTTFEVPVGSTDGTSGGTDGSGSASQTVADQTDSETAGTRTVQGYNIATSGSTTVVATSSYRIDHIAGVTEFWFAKQRSAGNNGNSHGSSPSGSPNGPSMESGTGYRWLSNGRSVTTLTAEGNFEAYSSGTTVTTNYTSSGMITIETVNSVDADTRSVATAESTTADRLWQDDYAAGHGRIAAARSSSSLPGGPNLITSSSYKYDSDLTLTINPSLFPTSTSSSGSSGGSSGSSGNANQNGSQSNYTAGSGTSTNPGGSGTSSTETVPVVQVLGTQYNYMRDAIAAWDAADKGYDLTGTVTETSNSSFFHKEQLSQFSEDLMRMEQGRKVGAVQFQASSLNEVLHSTESSLSIKHETGRGFKIDEALDEVKTKHKWTDKQISTRSEYREYAGPTVAPSTTMAALRNNSPTSNQSLLGDAPSGSTVVFDSIHTTTYISPLADVTGTVTNLITPYVYNGEGTMAPILFDQFDESKVNVTADVTNIGYVFNGSSTLRSKVTFRETDNGTVVRHQGLNKTAASSPDEPDSYHLSDSISGGITQTLVYTKPATGNSITVPNQGTTTTVAPGGESYTTNNTLLDATAVQEPMAEFIGEFSTKTGYVSNSTSTSSNSGTNSGDNSQTGGGQQGSQTGGQDGSTTESQPEQTDPDIHEIMMKGWESFRKHSPYHAGILRGFFVDGAKGDIDLAVDVAELAWKLRNPTQNLLNVVNFINNWIVPVVTASEEDIARVTETLQTIWSLGEKLKSGRINELTPEELHYHYLLVMIAGEVIVLLQEELGKLDPTETTGRIIGLIAYEILMEVALGALVVATFGGSGAAGAGKLATLPAKLRNIGGVADTIADAVETGPLGKRLRDLLDPEFLSLKGGFIDKYVDGTVSPEELDRLKGILPHLKNRDGDPLQLELNAELNGYNQGLHRILLSNDGASIPKGTLAEEVGHAIDKVSGLYDDGRLKNALPKLKKLFGSYYNEVWHMQLFERIAEMLESDGRNIFHVFLERAAAAKFRQAADEIRRGLRMRGFNF